MLIVEMLISAVLNKHFGEVKVKLPDWLSKMELLEESTPYTLTLKLTVNNKEYVVDYRAGMKLVRNEPDISEWLVDNVQKFMNTKAEPV